MKRTILSICALAIASIAIAQDSGNNMWIGGAAGIATTKNDNHDKTTSGVFGPSFGYMVNENMAAGITLRYSSDKTEEGGTKDKTTMTLFELAPFFRYYKSLGDNCSLYGRIEIAYGFGKDKFEPSNQNSSEQKYTSISSGIAPGIQYWFHDNWSVNAEWGVLGFSSRTDKGQNGADDYKSSSFTAGLDLTALT
ncbi:MAG TPA: porin family protein, partial [Bacteroidia bacterium]|nr:porin family protein [Bacteroidia bacterium]